MSFENKLENVKLLVFGMDLMN